MQAGLSAVLLSSLFIVIVGSRTDYHASADVAELGLLAVVVLELVGFVVDTDNGLLRFWFLLFHLNFLLIYEVDLDTCSSRTGNSTNNNCTRCLSKEKNASVPLCQMSLCVSVSMCLILSI